MRYKLKVRQTVLVIYSVILLIILSSCSSFRYKEELVEAYYNLGNAYSDLGKLDDSATVFTRALQIDPSFPSASYNLGIVHIRSKNYKKGIEVLQDLLEQDPGNTIVLKVLAWGFLKSGDLAQAIEVYESVLKIDGYNRDVLNNITILMIKEHMYEEAYDYLIQLESLGDADSNTFYNLGITERELNISSGVKWFESAYQKDQTVQEVLITLIDALTGEHSYSRVIELYDILIDMDPSPALLFDKAFILLTAIEDYELGIPALEKAMESGFSDLDRIDELKSYPDLLNRDRILSVFIDYPLQSPANHEQESTEVPVGEPQAPD